MTEDELVLAALQFAIESDPSMPPHLIRIGKKWFRAEDGQEVDPPGWQEST